MGSLMRFIREESGADLVEYALLVGIVALGAIATLGGVRDSIIGLFTNLTGQIDGALSPTP